MLSIRHIFGAIVIALLTTACDSIPVLPEKTPEIPPEQTDTEVARTIPLEETQIEVLDLTKEDTDQIDPVQDTLEQAVNSLPPFQQDAYLTAASELLKRNRLEQAKNLLDHVDVRGLPVVVQARKQLIAAQIHFFKGDPDRALRLISRNLRLQGVNPIYIAESLDLKATIQLLKGEALLAVQDWVSRENYLVEEQNIRENRRKIWLALGHLNEIELQLAQQETVNQTLAAWFDLAILALEFVGDRYGLEQAFSQWVSLNQFHPAVDLVRSLILTAGTQNISQIALLLPLSSKFGQAASEVYDGFRAAHELDSDPNRPDIMLYDIGGEPQLASNYMGVAIAEGADVVVGPLGKDAVQELTGSRELTVPTLLLGNSSNYIAIGSFEFDLSPESEAIQVANQMYQAGYRRVVALYPENAWGQRMFDAFQQQWLQLGGVLIETQTYQEASNDFTAPISKLFDLTESKRRRALLATRTGLKLELEQRRRQDIDGIFLAARHEQARLIKPQINFFQGLELPVFTTSHSYSGKFDPVNDADLNGITIIDMPWTVEDNARARKFRSLLRDAGYANINKRLFAFGFDAYNLGLAIASTNIPMNSSNLGLSAELSFSDQGRVIRKLQVAKFRDGLPVTDLRF